MNGKELKILKRRARFFWLKAERIEKDMENELKVVNRIEYDRRKTEGDALKYASTMLTITIERLKGNGKKRD